MESRTIAVLRDLAPPLIWRAMRSVLVAAKVYQPRAIQERDAAWYDNGFKNSAVYQGPYRESPYYFLWCVVVDRVIKSGTASVLDIGCGSGQVASFLSDRGLKSYVGIDLSSAAISLAKSQCPSFKFIETSAYDTDVFETIKYDTVICLEFLEHVNEDLSILKRIASGTRFIGTVPSTPFEAHVRFFKSCNEVAQRYSGLFSSFSVDEFQAPAGDARFFLIDGVKR